MSLDKTKALAGLEQIIDDEVREAMASATAQLDAMAASMGEEITARIQADNAVDQTAAELAKTKMAADLAMAESARARERLTLVYGERDAYKATAEAAQAQAAEISGQLKQALARPTRAPAPAKPKAPPYYKLHVSGRDELGRITEVRMNTQGTRPGAHYVATVAKRNELGRIIDVTVTPRLQ